jgi:type 1 glutamine amidotransferase
MQSANLKASPVEKLMPKISSGYLGFSGIHAAKWDAIADQWSLLIAT